MSRYEVLWLLLAVEAFLFLAALVLIFGHGAWMSRYERRNAEALERGRIALAGLADRPRLAEDDLATLRALPRRLQVRLFTELTPSLSGSQREKMAALADEIGLTGTAERLCRSGLWWRRLRGVRLLTALGGGENVVPPLFRDPHPAVRAEAVEWAGEHPEPAVIERLVELLPTPGRVGHWVIRDSLLRIGLPAVPSLAQYLAGREGPTAAAALDVAAGLPDPRFGPAAIRLCGDPLPSVRARAASLAGSLGGDEAVGALQGLLDDEVPEVRAAAAAALGRLGHWPVAPRLAGMLRDPAWVVRSQSALALRRFGGPGLLLLRRALADEDRFAADIAHQVLDMPDTTADRDQWR